MYIVHQTNAYNYEGPCSSIMLGKSDGYENTASMSKDIMGLTTKNTYWKSQ